MDITQMIKSRCVCANYERTYVSLASNWFYLQMICIMCGICFKNVQQLSFVNLY